MTRNEIIQKVQLCLDEINGLSEGQTIMDVQIEGQLDDSAVSLLQLLPSFLGDPVAPTVVPTVTDHIIALPADFLKLGHVKLASWKRDIVTALPMGHPRVMYEDYDYLRANKNNPLVAIKNEAGTKKLYVAPVEDGDTVTLFYVKRPTAAETLPDKLIDMLSWHTAERIFTSYGEQDKVTLAKTRLNELIQTATLI